MTISLHSSDERGENRKTPEYDRETDKNGAETPVFVIGLTMAGAISAGAYTAGVVDYLVRAMHAHNARVGKPGGPHHKVMIKAMSGASAGGMCAGLIATNLMAIGSGNPEDPDWDHPTEFPYPGQGDAEKHGTRMLNRIYKAWVSEVKMWNPENKTGLLGLQDFNDNFVTFDQQIVLHTGASENAGENAKAAPTSVLNGAHLDHVATTALSDIPAWPASRKGCDFISSELDIFLTTTAINGTYYKIDFMGGSPFVMEQHSIVRHFRINRLGTGLKLSSPWLKDWEDKGINLDPHTNGDTLPLTSTDGGDWAKLTVGSLATGAFPIGLAPRVINATPLELGKLPEKGEACGGALPYDIPARLTVRPDFGPINVNTHTPYISVDGGMINNEPFAYARYAIRQGYTDSQNQVFLYPNPQSAKAAHRAVLMVDPFPEGESFRVTHGRKLIEKLGILPVGSKLVSTLMGQARFKPTELAEAHDPNVHSRFLISPQRNDGIHPERVGSQAIACGLLGGFGGFLDESFRQHDFILGQRNCQRFLNTYFSLDPDNPVLQLSSSEKQSVRDGWQAAGKKGEPEVPIIDPGAMAEADHEVALHDWPQMHSAELNAMMKQVKVRLQKLVDAELDAVKEKSWRLGAALGLAWNIKGKSWTMTYALGAILGDMILRDQLSCFHSHAYTPADRLLLAELAECCDTYLSADELVKKVAVALKKGTLPKKIRPEDPESEVPSIDVAQKFLRQMARKDIVKSAWMSEKYCLDTDHILKLAA